jgi:hypothetical protein
MNCKGRVYQLRIEYDGTFRPIFQSRSYKDTKDRGKEKYKELKKGETLIMTTGDGCEVIRWM